MSSRDAILAAVRRNRPDALPLPPPVHFETADGDLAARFADAVAAVGGEVVRATPDEVADLFAARFPDAAVVASTAPDLVAGTMDLGRIEDPHDLADLDVLVCRGVLGVAESGAVWLPESRLGHRAAPFITQHLVLALDAADLVGNMHEAYARLDPGSSPGQSVVAEGFGVFVAGPSKTADIEQSLVIGAHGARSLTVFLLDTA